MCLPEWRKPDFFIVGAARSGTSSLYNYLIQHPAVFMPDAKEPHFFYNNDEPGAPVLGEKDLSEYLELFKGVPDDTRAGEASTSYLYVANAAREIKQLQENAKIIMILRNPVDRAYSHYWTSVRDGVEPLSFEEALEAEPERKRQNRWHGLLYVETGGYAEQVSRYLDVFGRERVQIHLFEDLSQNAEKVCGEVFSFLDVDPSQSIDVTRIYNRAGPVRNRLLAQLLIPRGFKKPIKRVLPRPWRDGFGDRLRTANRKPVPEMDPKTRLRLQETFGDDILRLEGLIGRDLSRWRDPAR